MVEATLVDHAFLRVKYADLKASFEQMLDDHNPSADVGHIPSDVLHAELERRGYRVEGPTLSLAERCARGTQWEPLARWLADLWR